MIERDKTLPSEASIHKIMELAWSDHHHARDQTWKTVQIVAALAAGLFTVDFNYENIWATLLAAILVILAAGFGAAITWNHRKLERRKFIHLMNCEESLGLHRDDLIPLNPEQKIVLRRDDLKQPIQSDADIKALIEDGQVSVPEKFEKKDIISFRKKNNTALFILRMHIIIILFSVLLVGFRLFIK